MARTKSTARKNTVACFNPFSSVAPTRAQNALLTLPSFNKAKPKASSKMYQTNPHLNHIEGRIDFYNSKIKFHAKKLEYYKSRIKGLQEVSRDFGKELNSGEDRETNENEENTVPFKIEARVEALKQILS